MPQSAEHHPAMNDPNAFVLYRYHPSLPAAVVFIVCFSVSTGLHINQAVTRRSAFFTPFIIGGLFESVGYVGRALAHNYEYNLGIYLMQILLLLVAPALFAATIYMALGRVILLTEGETYAPIRARRLTKTFVCGDAISFMVQAGGGGLMADIKTMTFGKHLVVVGLLFQIIFFGIFIITGGIFHFRITQTPTPASTLHTWQPYMFTLYTASILILIRSVFRVIEFSGGNDGVLLRNEIFLYMFDAVLMVGVMIAFNILHPGNVVRKRASGGAIRMEERSVSQSSEESPKVERQDGESKPAGWL